MDRKLADRAPNEPLTNADTLLFQTFMSETQKDIYEWDTKISQAEEKAAKLQEEIQILSAHRQKAVERLSQLQVWLAPHTKVPAEILTQIFMFCLNDQPIKIPPGSSLFDFPWTLRQVCSRWRSIVDEDPRLWRNIHIGRGEKIPQAVVHEVLSRSGNLDIRLSAYPVGSALDIFDLSLEHRVRVRSLALTMNCSRKENISKLASFTKLESLSLNYRPVHTLSYIPVKHLPLPPTVRELHFLSIAWRSSPITIGELNLEPSAWANLTKLSITALCIHALDALQILAQCRELLECIITLARDSNEEILYPKSNITVPALRVFTLHPKEFMLEPFLNTLILPSLISLSIGDLRGSMFWPQSGILALIQRSQCRLKCFLSGKNYVSVNYVLPLLRAMPDLIIADLDIESYIPEEILEAIQEENLVPNLEELSMSVNCPEALWAFLRSRWSKGPGEGILRGTIYLDAGESEEEKAVVERIKVAKVETGSNITFQYTFSDGF